MIHESLKSHAKIRGIRRDVLKTFEIIYHAKIKEKKLTRMNRFARGGFSVRGQISAYESISENLKIRPKFPIKSVNGEPTCKILIFVRLVALKKVL